MEFRLIYKGSLPAETSSPRIKWKRAIRSQIHPQLKSLVSTHPMLAGEGSSYSGKFIVPGVIDSPDDAVDFWERSAIYNKVVSISDHIHRFAPLVTEHNYNGCSLDILFLRRDAPGSLVRYGGDIDNRLKVLFDALRMPRETQEVEDAPQEQTENPCFCLLADDKYIDKVAVTTDRLLSPMETGDAVNDVLLIIHVVASLFDRVRDAAPI